MSEPRLSFGARVALAWRVLTDPNFAGSLQEPLPLALALGSAVEAPPAAGADREVTGAVESGRDVGRAVDDEPSARVLLRVLQREGRLVDFLQQDIESFADDEVGAAARVVHDGCRTALNEHASIVPVMREDEQSRVDVAIGYEPSRVKLTGKVQGEPPYRGTLIHRGWRLERLELPTLTDRASSDVIAPAEVEL